MMMKLLQHILFFKDLDIPLKEVKEIMASVQFDKMGKKEGKIKI